LAAAVGGLLLPAAVVISAGHGALVRRRIDGGWRLEVGGWRLEVGGWRLEVGGWRGSRLKNERGGGMRSKRRWGGITL
jgi:hypothetical protein